MIMDYGSKLIPCFARWIAFHTCILWVTSALIFIHPSDKNIKKNEVSDTRTVTFVNAICIRDIHSLSKFHPQ